MPVAILSTRICIEQNSSIKVLVSIHARKFFFLIQNLRKKDVSELPRRRYTSVGKTQRCGRRQQGVHSKNLFLHFPWQDLTGSILRRRLQIENCLIANPLPPPPAGRNKMKIFRYLHRKNSSPMVKPKKRTGEERDNHFYGRFPRNGGVEVGAGSSACFQA